MVEPEPCDVGEVFRLGYRPALDGVRAFAVGAVVAHHLTLRAVGSGYLGVTVFFTLSGFLITTILLAERSRTGRISLRSFYRRRALRLIPAYVAVIAVVGVAALVTLTPQNSRRAVGEILASLTYSYNYVTALGPPDQAFGFLGHTWSLAVEEQFYLLWPSALVVMMWRGWRPERVLRIVLVAIVVISAWRCSLFLVPGGNHLWAALAFDTRADSLLVGCALAIILHKSMIAPVSGSRRRVTTTSLAAVALIVCVLVPVSKTWVESVGYLVVPVLTALVLLGLVGTPRSWLHRVLELTPLVWLGGISYGLYLWHYVVIWMLAARWPWPDGVERHSDPAFALTAVAGTLAVSWASYRFLETPFLRMKRRQRAPAGGPVMPAEPVPDAPFAQEREVVGASRTA